MRRFTLILLAAIMLFSVTAYGVEMNLVYDDIYHYYNVDDIFLEVNGKEIITKEMPPIILMDRTLVPVREVFETLGAEVSWSGNTGQTKISYNGIDILFTMGSRTYYLGKSRFNISEPDPAPMIINDKTMVPVRLVADLLGFDVEWNEKTRTVSLYGDENNADEKYDPNENKKPVDENKPDEDEVSPPKDGEINKVYCTVNGSDDLIYLAYSAPVTPVISRYDTPDRVVIDFEGAQLINVFSTINFDGGTTVTSVRSANHEDKARIVLDVKKQPNIGIYRSATGIVIVAEPAGTKYTTKIGNLTGGAIYEPPKNNENNDKDPTPQKPDGSVELDISGTQDTTQTNSFDYNTVVIDAGHGGTDPGAISEGVNEKDITLKISLMVRDMLEENGYNVTMTRTGDTYPTLSDRVDIASKKTNGKIPALFVSIHCNSFENSATNGTQVYYHPDSKYGTVLAANIYNSNLEYTDLKAAQIHDGSHLFVIRKTIQPAALVETAFLSNDGDREYLNSAEGQTALAQGIYSGIVKTMEQMKSDKGIK